MDTKIVVAYLAGLVTMPVAAVVFRKQLLSAAVEIIGSEDLDEKLYKLMQARLAAQDAKKKAAEEAADE